jgi:hypothetical protein
MMGCGNFPSAFHRCKNSAALFYAKVERSDSNDTKFALL